jgi:hypothetical protein
MSQSISDIPKKRGRPKSGGRKTGVMVRLPNSDLAALDRYIADKQPGMTRPEAIRECVRQWTRQEGVG